jgi:hypothetical protein
MISSLCLSMIFSEDRFPLFRIMPPVSPGSVFAGKGVFQAVQQRKPERAKSRAWGGGSGVRSTRQIGFLLPRQRRGWPGRRAKTRFALLPGHDEDARAKRN